MKGKQRRITVWALAALILSLIFLTAGAAYAGEGPPGTPGAPGTPVAPGTPGPVALADPLDPDPVALPGTPGAPGIPDPVALADPPEPDEPVTPSVTEDGPRITRYTVQKGGSTWTGQIYTGNKITMVVSIFDERIKKGKPTPRAVVNTASFIIESQSKVVCENLKVNSNGCTYRLTFKDLIYTGTGNEFNFSLSYTGVSPPLPMEQLTISLNQCVEYVEPDPQEPPEVVIKGTGFILKDARYNDGQPVYAGKAFSLSAVILATNGSHAVENVSVAFSPPEELTFADGASVVYIGTMAPGGSVPVSATLQPSANIQEGSYTIGIDVNGVNQQTGDPVSAHMTISLPILQPERFEIFNTMLPTDLMPGMDMGMGYGSVTLVNQGRGAVSNVTFDITGKGLSLEDGKMYIGNVGGGEQRSADFNLMADVPGQIEARVVVTYENVRGEVKTLEHPFTVNVMEGEFVDPDWPDDPWTENPGEDVGGGARGGMQGWLLIIIIAAAAAAVTTVLLLRRRKKKRLAEAELDDDADDDADDDDD